MDALANDDISDTQFQSDDNDMQSDSYVSDDNEDMQSQSDSGDNNDMNDDSSNEQQLFSEKPLSYDSAPSASLDLSKTGVVYLSSIPPFMKPTKLRHLLAQYGEIGRVYLTPEDARTAMRRKKYKGNKRLNFVEGWVEFHCKKVARKLADTLNANPIGGKKRAYYHDDIWSLKYLPRFKWTNLTEQIAYERAVKEQRMRTEMSQAKKNTKKYMKNVEKGKMIESMEARNAAKGNVEKNKVERVIRQRKSVVSDVRTTVDSQQASALSRMFS